MKKKVTTILALAANLSLAGGLTHNTNQSAHFVRNMARDASTEVDAIYANPAGTAFFDDGWQVSINSQTVWQTRIIKTNFANGEYKKYEGEAFIPTMPSLLVGYHKGNLAVSGAFTIAGGGGSVEYDDGLPMIDAFTLSSAGKTLGKVGGGASLEGTSYILGFTLGASYRFLPYFSAYVGGRFNYNTSSYDIDIGIPNEKGKVDEVGVQVDQSGYGITPILGLAFEYKRLTAGIKFEYRTRIELENETKDMPATLAKAFANFADGVKTDADMPSYLAIGLQYAFLDNLRGSIGYHRFFDAAAEYANGSDKYLESTNELLFGLEWDATKRFTFSAGAQFTRLGLSDEYLTEINMNVDANSYGCGLAFRATDWLRLNLAYFRTFYYDWKGDKEAYGKNTYDRRNQLVAIGADFKF